jgi:hypothetical protein
MPRDGEEAGRVSEPEFRIEPWGEDDLPLLEKLLGDPAMTEHLVAPRAPAEPGRHRRNTGLIDERRSSRLSCWNRYQ